METSSSERLSTAIAREPADSGARGQHRCAPNSDNASARQPRAGSSNDASETVDRLDGRSLRDLRSADIRALQFERPEVRDARRERGVVTK